MDAIPLVAVGHSGIDDPLEVRYLALAQDASLEDYYRTLSVLTPFLRDERWRQSVSGYYTSSKCRVFRLSYFAQDSIAPDALLAETASQLGLVTPHEAESLGVVRFHVEYGGSEQDFRLYLCAYTRFGLDLLEADTLHAKRLIASWRLKVMNSGSPARSYLEPTLLRNSHTYQSLRHNARDTFWNWFGFSEPGHTPWAHMLVNMVCGQDWSVHGPLSCDEVNRCLAQTGADFNVPSGWTPT